MAATFQPNEQRTVIFSVQNSGNVYSDIYLKAQIQPGGNVGEATTLNVAPGATVDMSISLTSPSSGGTFDLVLEAYVRQVGTATYTRVLGPLTVDTVTVTITLNVLLVSVRWA